MAHINETNAKFASPDITMHCRETFIETSRAVDEREINDFVGIGMCSCVGAHFASLWPPDKVKGRACSRKIDWIILSGWFKSRQPNALNFQLRWILKAREGMRDLVSWGSRETMDPAKLWTGLVTRWHAAARYARKILVSELMTKRRDDATRRRCASR